MVNIDFLKLIKKDIFAKKFSSFLTLLAISFGIFLIFLILNISTNLKDSFNSESEKFGTNLITVSPSKTDKIFNEKFLKNLERFSYVKQVYPIYEKSIFVYDSSKKNPKNVKVMALPFTTDSFKTFNFEINKGSKKLGSKGFDVYVGSEFLENIYNDKIGINSKLYLGDTKFKIKGELKSFGVSSDDLKIYISKEKFTKLFDNQYLSILLKIDLGVDVFLKKEELQLYFDNKYEKDFVRIKTLTEEIESFNKIIKVVTYVFYLLAAISLIVGFLGILNVMFVIVNQRIREIGIMKSIGATKKDILIYYIVFSGVFGMLGAMLGITFGIIVLKTIIFLNLTSSLGFLKIEIIYVYVLYLIIFGFIIGIICGYVPAKKASNLNIIEAIRK